MKRTFLYFLHVSTSRPAHVTLITANLLLLRQNNSCISLINLGERRIESCSLVETTPSRKDVHHHEYILDFTFQFSGPYIYLNYSNYFYRYIFYKTEYLQLSTNIFFLVFNDYVWSITLYPSVDVHWKISEDNGI